MPFVIEIDYTKLRSYKGRFITAGQWMSKKRHEQIMDIGRRWVELAREYAPKRTGEFARGIRYTTYEQENEVGIRGYIPQPLGSFIIEGTKPHQIRAKNAGALHFIWEEADYIEVIVPRVGGRKTELMIGGGLLDKDLLVIGKGYVQHPGTKPNPFTARALDQVHVEASGMVKNAVAGYRAIIFGTGEGT
jgi:hypothetical protein